MVTLDDVADAAGVSRSTASAALNGAEHVSPETRRRVIEAAARLNYSAHEHIHRLAIHSPAKQQIGIIMPVGSGRGTFTAIMTAASNALQDAGFTSTIITLNPHAKTLMLPDDLDAALLIGTGTHLLPLLRPLLTLNKPIICIESDVAPVLGSFEVANDAALGIYNATSHLLHLGHSQPAFLNYPLDSSIGRACWQGFKRALAEQHISLPFRLLLESEGSAAGGYMAVQLLLRQPPLPQALVCACDEMALGALQAIADAGRRVPDDIAVTGMGDIEMAAYAQPPLTTIRVNTSRIGEEAASVLIHVLNETYRGSERTLIPNTLIHRESSGGANARHHLSMPPRYPRSRAITARLNPLPPQATPQVDRKKPQEQEKNSS